MQELACIKLLEPLLMVCGNSRGISEIFILLSVHFILYIFDLNEARFRFHVVFVWKLRLWISLCGCIFLHHVCMNCGDGSPISDHMYL